MTPARYLAQPKRSLDEAQREIEQDRARAALARIKINGVPLQPGHFEPRYTALNSAPKREWWQLPSYDDAAPLVGAERVVVTIWWCARALGWIAAFGIVAGAVLAVVSGG